MKDPVLFCELESSQKVEVTGFGGDFEGSYCLVNGGCFVGINKKVFSARIVQVSYGHAYGKAFFVMEKPFSLGLYDNVA